MSFWYKDFFQYAVAIALAYILSLFTGYFSDLLLLVCFAIIIQQSLSLIQLESWLSNGAEAKNTPRHGLLADIYHHIFQIKKTNKKRKKKLITIIEQFRHSTAALPDAVVVLGDHDEISWFNDAAKNMLGLRSTNKGQAIPLFIPNSDFVGLLNNKDKDAILSIPSPINENITLQIKIVNYRKNTHLLVVHDITYLKNIERMRKDFVDNISHELRTPLTVLKGYLETLTDFKEDHSPMLVHSLEQMQNQTLRMQHLVDDLLILSNLETQQTSNKCVGINQLLTQVCSESGAIESFNNRVELFLDSDLNILGNNQELHSAFSNLIVNALKYSPKGSIVTVQWFQLENSLVLDVRDQGEGIPEAEIAKITERFYRINAKREQTIKGTGLGLAIVKHVLARHDAVLDINSQPGQGSSFKCIFPKHRFCINAD